MNLLNTTDSSPNFTNKSKSASDAPKKNSIVKLVVFIVVLVGASYFIKTTYRYYTQIQEGTIDLSSFQSDQLSKISNSAAVANNAFVPAVQNFTNDPVVGPADAVVTIVAFEDFQCEFCGQAFPIIKTILREYENKIRFVYRDFPVSDAHPYAQKAAEAAQCAHDQSKFWPYHDRLYTNQDALGIDNLKQYARQLNLDMVVFEYCLDSDKYALEVEEDLTDGLAAGVTGTPTFFINGHKVSGVISLSGFRQIIDYFSKNQ